MTAAFWNTHVRDNESYLFSALYPVGSIYINSNVSTNPATLLGFGTWSAWAAGRVLVGIDAGQTEFDGVEETGGSKLGAGANTFGRVSDGTFVDKNAVTTNFDLHSKSAGGGGSPSVESAMTQNSSILQPYITCYMWKRTA